MGAGASALPERLDRATLEQMLPAGAFDEELYAREKAEDGTISRDALMRRGKAMQAMSAAAELPAAHARRDSSVGAVGADGASADAAASDAKNKVARIGRHCCCVMHSLLEARAASRSVPEF